jgi:flagellar assembly protein FliH
LSRIFKSNYVKIGIPKHIKSSTSVIRKIEDPKPIDISQIEDLEEEAANIIDDAKKMYLKIIEEANIEAQKILEAANQEREEIHLNSAEQGNADGYATGLAQGLNQAEAIIQQAAELKLQLDMRSKSIYKEAEIEIMEMVLDISRKVIGEELTQNADVLISLIKKALEKCTFKEKLTIRVSEQDYNHVINNKDRIVILTEGINDLEIICDKALKIGSCIVETQAGEINSGLTVQLNEISRAFEYLMRNE